MQIKELIVEAFSKSEYGYTGEAELVDKIRQNNDYLEVVYLEENKVIGHGLLSDSKIENHLNETVAKGLVLAPISVLPSHQGKGIGSQLMTALE
ncbi:GNAT family N-acetyltransferase, partial [Acinetobacter baumannii]|uniref:GNAT family N-acetyltransferase n=1 Tax=Acinetobacter baumannii TaxID=470 RepID=UPI001AECD2F3